MAKGKKAKVVSPIQQRLLEICQYRGISLREMSRAIGRSDNYVNTLHNDVTSGVLCNVLEVYPEVSPVWLLTGRGTMLDSVVIVQPADNDDEVGIVSVEGSKESYRALLRALAQGQDVEFKGLGAENYREFGTLLSSLSEGFRMNTQMKKTYMQLMSMHVKLKEMLIQGGAKIFPDDVSSPR